eukprot:3184546-Amphidinium_carterae.1
MKQAQPDKSAEETYQRSTVMNHSGPKYSAKGHDAKHHNRISFCDHLQLGKVFQRVVVVVDDDDDDDDDAAAAAQQVTKS